MVPNTQFTGYWVSFILRQVDGNNHRHVALAVGVRRPYFRLRAKVDQDYITAFKVYHN